MRIAGAAIALLLSLLAPVPAWAQGSPQVAPSVRHTQSALTSPLSTAWTRRAAPSAPASGFGASALPRPRCGGRWNSNADRVTVDLETTEQRGAVSWSQRRLTGTFRHDWDLRRFPFDRHSLEILLEEGAQEEGTFAYVADLANSGYSLHASVGGWRIAGMRVEVAPASYATNFEDSASPAQGGSRFTRLRAVLELERNG